jgi:hypothetical protein
MPPSASMKSFAARAPAGKIRRGRRHRNTTSPKGEELMPGTTEVGCIGAVIGAVVLVMFFIAVSALWDIRAALRGIYRIL